MRVFRKGCAGLGVNPNDAVPATDSFLSDAQRAWYPDAPMGKVPEWTVENVPIDYFTGNGENAMGATLPNYNGTKIIGTSRVFFNSKLAFSSARSLFITMGHELVHVGQFAALAGQPRSILTSDFIDMLDYHAYSWQNSVGGTSLNSFTRDEIARWSTQYQNWFGKMHFFNFPYVNNVKFYYPL